MKLIFFGTPLFSSEILKCLLEQKFNVVAVVCRPDKPKGRSGKSSAPPVKSLALQHHIPVHQPDIASTDVFEKVLSEYQADLFIVVAYGEILKKNILNLPKVDCINIHASLLPKYRGAAPIHRAIIAGEKETGITIIQMVRKMDAGDILKQQSIPIPPNATFGQIENELCELSKTLIIHTINDYKNGKIPTTPQNESEVTFAPKISTLDCQINWNKSANDTYNLIRGTSPRPGAWCVLNINGEKKRLKILKAEILMSVSGMPGEVHQLSPKAFIVSCATGALKLLEVQLEGKRTMKAEEFGRGLLNQQFTFQSEL